MKTKSFSREERREMVKVQFAIWIKNTGHSVAKTSYQIARALNLTASCHFRSILSDMVEDEILIAERVQRSGRWDTTMYSLNPELYTAPKKRTASVKSAGKVIGQLELFS